LRSWNALDALLDTYLRATRATDHPKSSATDHSEPGTADHSKSSAAYCSESSPRAPDDPAANRVANSYVNVAPALTAWLFLFSVAILVFSSMYPQNRLSSTPLGRARPGSWFSSVSHKIDVFNRPLRVSPRLVSLHNRSKFFPGATQGSLVMMPACCISMNADFVVR